MLILSKFCLKNLKRELDFKITSTTQLRSNRLQQEVDNQEARQLFRINKIEDQAKEIKQLTNEVANVRAFCGEVENQVRAKMMQIQHYQRESSEQSEQIEKLEEENQTIKKSLEAANQKL